MRRLKEGELTREKTLEVKDFIRGLEESVEIEKTKFDEDYASFVESGAIETNPDSMGSRIEAGSNVVIRSSKKRGTVVRAAKRGHWVVQSGSIRLTVAETDLAMDAQTVAAVTSYEVNLAPESAVRRAVFELDVRGMRLEEAIRALEQQLDAASLANLREFSIIHGKGNGVLQKGMHDYLGHSALVGDYYFARPELGGFGKTIVVLK